MGLTSRARDEKAHRLASDAVTWFDREAALCEFQDARLGERVRMLLKQIGGDIGQSIPMVLPRLGEYQGGLSFLLQ
ncbi:MULTISPECIES: transposase [Bradyrhizobium]|uniref:transposase n=1 Tax=Bradyrhizobium TaxID=374 RepID=UPI001E4B794F|nr:MULTISPECIES: transposase [Bradyrhizobium]